MAVLDIGHISVKPYAALFPTMTRKNFCSNFRTATGKQVPPATCCVYPFLGNICFPKRGTRFLCEVRSEGRAVPRCVVCASQVTCVLAALYGGVGAFDVVRISASRLV